MEDNDMELDDKFSIYMGVSGDLELNGIDKFVVNNDTILLKNDEDIDMVFGHLSDGFYLTVGEYENVSIGLDYNVGVDLVNQITWWVVDKGVELDGNIPDWFMEVADAVEGDFE